MIKLKILFFYLILTAQVFAQSGNKLKLDGPSKGLEDQNQHRSLGDEFFNDDDFFKSSGHMFKEMELMRQRFREMMMKDPFLDNFDDFGKISGNGQNKNQDIVTRQYEDDKYYYVEISKNNSTDSNFKVKVENEQLIVTNNQEITKENTDSKGNKNYHTTKSSITRGFPLAEYVDPKGYEVLDQKDKVVIKFKKTPGKSKKGIKMDQEDYI